MFSFFGGHAMCALWVNLEVPINCVFLEHWNLYIFLLLASFDEGPMGKFGSPINCVLLEHCNLYIFRF